MHYRLCWGLADHGHTNLDVLFVLDWLQLDWANLLDLQLLNMLLLLNMLHGLGLHHLLEVKVKMCRSTYRRTLLSQIPASEQPAQSAELAWP